VNHWSKSIPLTLIVFCFLDSIAFGAIPKSRSSGIPFELTNNLVILQGSINGSRPLAFILDTGASTTVISDSRAKELGLKLEGKTDATTQGGSIAVSFVKGVSLNLSGVEFPGMTLAAIRLSGLEAGLGRTVDGILGYEVFNRFVVEIDYASKVVRFYEPQGYKYSGRGEVIPISIEDNTPFVIGRITGPKPIEGKFLIDRCWGILTIANICVKHRLLILFLYDFITSGALLRLPVKWKGLCWFQLEAGYQTPVVNFFFKTGRLRI
jgi:predicted aspartyl protease